MSKIDWELGKPRTFTLAFDEPKTGNNQYGTWYMYGCIHGGEEKVFFASGRLHQMIQLCGFSRGDSFTVLKKEDDDQQFPFFTINGKTFDTLQEAKNIETATAPNTDEDIPF